MKITCAYCDEEFALLLVEGELLGPAHVVPPHQGDGSHLAECPGAGTSVTLLLARVLLRELESGGFEVWTDAGKVFIKPTSGLMPEQIERIKALKPDLIAELEHRMPVSDELADGVSRMWDDQAIGRDVEFWSIAGVVRAHNAGEMERVIVAVGMVRELKSRKRKKKP